jgi:hypothetical protein
MSVHLKDGRKEKKGKERKRKEKKGKERKKVRTCEDRPHLFFLSFPFLSFPFLFLFLK